MNNKSEYILCAANWYKDLPLKYTEIPGSLLRPKNCDRGIVFAGLRHPFCLYQMVAMTGLRQCEAGEEIQRFLTSENRFVDRKEGAKIALECGQITELKWGSNLYSEDLY